MVPACIGLGRLKNSVMRTEEMQKEYNPVNILKWFAAVSFCNRPRDLGGEKNSGINEE